MARSISFDTYEQQAAAPAPDTSLESIALKRKIAEALMKEGMDYSPVRHWTQAAARVAQAIVGGMNRSAAEKQDSMLRDEGNKALLDMLPGQTTAPVTGGPSQAAAPPSAAVQKAAAALQSSEPPLNEDEQGVANFAQGMGTPNLKASIAGALAEKPAEVRAETPMQNRSLTAYAGSTPQQPQQDLKPSPTGWKPNHVIYHDYGGNPKNEDGVFNPYHALVFPDGSIRYRNPNDPYGQKAPHAYKMNSDAIGLSYAGPVGSEPTPQALETLRRENARIQQMFPGIKGMGHGEAYQATKGTNRQASRDGRDLVEASWRSNLGAQQQAAQQAPQAPMGQGQVADASGQTMPVSREQFQKMLANPYTRDLAQKLIIQQMPKPPLDDMGKAELEYKRAQTEKLRNEMQGGGAAEYGLVPQYATDAQGNIVPWVAGKNGTPKMIQLPGGAKPMTPGNLSEEKAAGRERGEVMGKNQGNLPAMENNAAKMVRDIDNLIKDPYLESMLGPVDGLLPNVSGDANRVQARIDQIQGKTFLQAFDSLRGAGQITEVEGRKATESLNRLQATRVGSKDFYEAAEEFKQDVQDLLMVARQKAGKGGSNGGWSIKRLD